MSNWLDVPKHIRYRTEVIEKMRELRVLLVPVIEEQMEFNEPWYKELFRILTLNWFTPEMKLYDATLNLEKKFYTKYK
jgi:hypothetical protein